MGGLWQGFSGEPHHIPGVPEPTSHSQDTAGARDLPTAVAWEEGTRAPFPPEKRWGETEVARAAPKPRPTWAPPHDAGAHRGKARSTLVGYLHPGRRACAGLSGRAPSLAERVHAYRSGGPKLEGERQAAEARGACVPYVGVFSPASSLGAMGQLD